MNRAPKSPLIAPVGGAIVSRMGWGRGKRKGRAVLGLVEKNQNTVQESHERRDKECHE
jgi:hypothetical protein